MGKGDFNVEEPDYYAGGSDNTQDEIKFGETIDNQEDNLDNITSLSGQKSTNNFYNQDYSNNANISNIGLTEDQNYIDSSNVVYEDKENLTGEDKIKYFMSTLNKKVLMILGAIVLVILIIVIAIIVNISSTNKSYFSEITSPEIVYMGETGNIEVKANGKENLENTKTIFESKDPNIVTVLNNELKGKEVLNPVIPIQEGRTKIDIKSTLGDRLMAEETKEIVVCPAFDTDLLLVKHISVIKDFDYTLTADYGEKECAKGITYESSDESIMTVSKNGKIFGQGIGKAILTIKKDARTISLNVEVTEKHVEMSKLSVTPEKVQLKPKENIRLKVAFYPENATTTKMNFSSSDPEIADVTESGLIVAKKPGEVIIKAVSLNSGLSKEVKVVVSKEISSEGALVTEMKLNKERLTLVQGESEKILATVTPDSARDKKILWESANPEIATVTNNGVIFAKQEGTTTITASTSNNISKTIEVSVSNMKAPVITSSDMIESDIWHNKPFILTFSGSENGVVYYYGTEIEKMNNKGPRITVTKDKKETYYVKACKNNVCSKEVSYVSKLDKTKPKVVTVAGIDKTPATEDKLQIALTDKTSLVQKWCVTQTDNSATCRWTTIKTAKNPTVPYTATYNDTYYIFAKDVAGNISDSYKFEIVNIQ